MQYTCQAPAGHLDFDTSPLTSWAVPEVSPTRRNFTSRASAAHFPIQVLLEGDSALLPIYSPPLWHLVGLKAWYQIDS